jgi:hypothetical protein
VIDLSFFFFFFSCLLKQTTLTSLCILARQLLKRRIDFDLVNFRIVDIRLFVRANVLHSARRRFGLGRERRFGRGRRGRIVVVIISSVIVVFSVRVRLGGARR